jgi:hypothetical protein
MSACPTPFLASSVPEKCPRFFSDIAKIGQTGAELNTDSLLDTQEVSVSATPDDPANSLIPGESDPSEVAPKNLEPLQDAHFDPSDARGVPEILAEPPRWMDPARRVYMRNYQRSWVARRRADWLQENGPCLWCGSWEKLEIDHVDPALKVTHQIWSWSGPRREGELTKCRVLCYACHKKRHAAPHGAKKRYEHGCRCAECRLANTREKRRWRAAKRARMLNVVSGSGFEPPAPAMSTQCSNRAELTGPKKESTAYLAANAETKAAENVPESQSIAGGAR